VGGIYRRKMLPPVAYGTCAARSARTCPAAYLASCRWYAHQRSGTMALARKEVADWYYERMQESRPSLVVS
jgi:hypothetical protein